MKKIAGFSLIELMFVIAMAGIFSALVVAHMISMDSKGKLESLIIRVDQTQTALDSFIQTNCQRGLHIQPTIAGLTADGLINNASSIESPYNGIVFEVSVSWIAPFSQTIKVDIGDNVMAQDLRQAASADNVDGTKLVWEKSFSYHVERDNEGARQFRAMFQPECN